MLKTLAAFVLMTSCCRAAETFDFISEGDLLATVTAQQLPATNDDVVSLTFSESGEALFGFGPVYTGDFDRISSDNGERWVSSPDGGLGGFDADNVRSIAFGDSNPPESTVFPNPLIDFFLKADEANPDLMGVGFTDPTTNTLEIFQVEGVFHVVPEPSTGVMLLVMLGFFGYVSNLQLRTAGGGAK